MRVRCFLVVFLLIGGVSSASEPYYDWLQNVAASGIATAQTELGLCLYRGVGVERDYKEAVRWLRKGAEAGNADAQEGLAVCYFRGEGVPRDFKESAMWTVWAAEQGNIEAQGNLIAYYWQGTGLTSDYVAAYRWYLILISITDKENPDWIAGLLAKMSPKQIRQAKKQAEEWKPKKWNDLKGK